MSRALLGRARRAWLPELPRDLWIFEGSVVAQALGNGMVVPFVVIYLHNVRGFSLDVSGLVAATFAGVSFLATFVGGDLADRFGPKLPLRLSLLVLAVGYGSFAFVETPWQAFAAIAVAGVGNGAYWPPQSAMLAELAGERHRHTAFALQRTMANLGFGLGAGLGGLIAVSARPGTFTAIFLLDAAAALASLALVGLVRRAPKVEEAEPPQEPQELQESTAAEAAPESQPLQLSQSSQSSRWRDLWGHKVILSVVFLNFVYVATGYAVFEMAVPVFAKNDVGVSESAIGLIFLASTLTIVLVQMPLMRLLEGRSRMRALAFMALLWAGCWLLVLVSGSLLAGLAAVFVFLLVGVLFALGECVLPVQSALVADLSPAGLRGRSLGLIPATYGLGFMVGQGTIGFILERSSVVVWLSAAALLGWAAVVALVLERQVPEAHRRTPRKVEAETMATTPAETKPVPDPLPELS